MSFKHNFNNTQDLEIMQQIKKGIAPSINHYNNTQQIPNNKLVAKQKPFLKKYGYLAKKMAVKKDPECDVQIIIEP